MIYVSLGVPPLGGSISLLVFHDVAVTVCGSVRVGGAAGRWLVGLGGGMMVILPLVVCWVAQVNERPGGLPALAPKLRRVGSSRSGKGGGAWGRGHHPAQL